MSEVLASGPLRPRAAAWVALFAAVASLAACGGGSGGSGSSPSNGDPAPAPSSAPTPPAPAPGPVAAAPEPDLPPDPTSTPPAAPAWGRPRSLPRQDEFGLEPAGRAAIARRFHQFGERGA